VRGLASAYGISKLALAQKIIVSAKIVSPVASNTNIDSMEGDARLFTLFHRRSRAYKVLAEFLFDILLAGLGPVLS
jgi:hypothetical protein